MSTNGTTPSIVHVGPRGAVNLDGNGGPPEFIVVPRGGEVTLQRGSDFYLKLDRVAGVSRIKIGDEWRRPTGEKFGPMRRVTIELQDVSRWECVGFSINDDDPVIIIDPR